MCELAYLVVTSVLCILSLTGAGVVTVPTRKGYYTKLFLVCQGDLAPFEEQFRGFVRLVGSLQRTFPKALWYYTGMYFVCQGNFWRMAFRLGIERFPL